MPEQAALPVALLWGTRDDDAELRDVLREAGAEIVFESDTANCSAAAIRAAAPKVVLINLSASLDEQSPLLDELAASPELRVVFNDPSITSELSGWDRARWRRHLSAKILDRDGDLPPRPEAAPALRLPRDGSSSLGRRSTPPIAPSERAVETEMDTGLAQIANSTSAGPPPRHDWARDLDAEGTSDVPLDSLDTEGVAQQTMGTDMEPTDEIAFDAGLELNDAEREVLGNLRTFDADGALDIVPPQTIGRAEQQVDLKLDESAFPGIQVDDFPANDLGEPLGAADGDLRLHAEVTSDEAMTSRLDAPAGFAGLSLAPLDVPGEGGTSAPTPATESPFSALALESMSGRPTEGGRASFAIDTAERAVSDLSTSAARTEMAGKSVSIAAPDVWVLLGGSGSEVGMQEFLGALPPTLPVAFVVLRADGSVGEAAKLPLEAWAERTAPAPGHAMLLDMTTAFRFDEAGNLLRTGGKAGRFDAVDTALENFAAQYGPRLGVMLFEGQGMDGSEGVAKVITHGGTVWTAIAAGETADWNARAKEMGALVQQGSALDMAQRISKQHG